MQRIFSPSPDGKVSNLIGVHRAHVGVTHADGTRSHRNLVDNGAGELVDEVMITSNTGEPVLEEVPFAPALVLEPVRITDFVLLITAARKASTSLDRFLQLHNPTALDLLAFEELQAALMPFIQPGRI